MVISVGVVEPEVKVLVGLGRLAAGDRHLTDVHVHSLPGACPCLVWAAAKRKAWDTAPAEVPRDPLLTFGS